MNLWTSDSGHVNAEQVDDVAVIEINRPEKLNALTDPMLEEIAIAVRKFGDGEEVRGLVLTGAGRAFCAGEDLRGIPTLKPGEIGRVVELFQDITRALLETKVPVIAAINGIAVGGAAEMTLACDARFGCDASEYFFPENSLGLTISNGSSILLHRAVGSHALPIILGARRMDAEECLQNGLLHRIVASGSLVETACEAASSWGSKGSSAKHHLAILRPQMADVEAAMTRESQAAVEAFESGVTMAGVTGFLERKTVK